MLATIVCPNCKKAVVQEASGWQCPACHRHFTYHRDILSFLDADERFNEGSYQDKQEACWTESARLRDRIRQSRLLSLLNLVRIKLSLSGRRDRIFYNEMHGRDASQLILDVGCGGGRHYFTEYGRVVGIDPVLDLLLISKTIYDEVYQASAASLPFADGSFDYVVSSDVIGHIPVAIKDAVFAEMYRVLKKGGRTVHVIETDADNCWFAFAHRYPELFQKYFVGRPGHISLEMPSQLRDRFLRHGFRQVAFRKMCGPVPECGTIAGFFDNEYKSKGRWIRLLVSLDRLLARNLAIKEMVNLLLEPVARLADACSSINQAAGALVVFEK